MTSDRALPRVKAALIQLIKSPDHRVFALTGRWGTGKTHLWREIEKQEWPSGTARLPIGASLFGVKTIRELQLRLLKQVSAKDKTGVQKVISSAYDIGKGLLQRFSGVSAEDLVLTWLPDMLKGRLVVIDDVERRNPALGIDEILGFIDEYVETYGVRVLLLLNEGRLGEAADVWATLREKVIDAEIVLNTTPEEAFEIALGDRDGGQQYFPAAASALGVLQISNIRVIKRVLNVLAQIHSGTGNAEDVSYERWVPSTVLMTASHYRAVEDPPTFDYLAGDKTWERFFRSEQDNRTPQQERWDKLLHALHINTADRFEGILQVFLESGILDVAALHQLFETYRVSQSDAGVDQRRNAFLERFYWAPEITNDVLLGAASTLLPDAPATAPPYLSEIVSAIEELGDRTLADAFLTAWLSAAEGRPEYRNLGSRSPRVGRTLHPRVLQKLEEMYDRQNPPLSLLDAVLHLSSTSGWSTRHEIPLRNSTPTEYEGVIRSLTGDRLGAVVIAHLQWVTRRVDNPVFSTATNNFIIAARNICASLPRSRIATILSRTFANHDLVDRLRPDPPAAH